MNGYLINKKILFDSDTCLLQNIDDPGQRITLNAISTRCLTTLFVHHGSVVAREELIMDSWGTTGFVVGSNSLNQVISQLRKSFKTLGEAQDIILTVSREGYRVNSAVEFERISAPAGAEIYPVVVKETPPVINLRHRVLILTVTACLLLFALSYAVTGWLFPGHTIDYQRYDYNDQDIHIYLQDGEADQEKINLALSLLRQDSDILSDSKGLRYVYINRTARERTVSFFFCTSEIDKPHVKCKSFVFVENR